MTSNNLGLDDEFMETMLSDFLDESQVYLANLNEKLIVVDELIDAYDSGEPPQIEIGLLNEMFRDAHSLKGLSAMLQLSSINGLTHKIENLFDAARDRKITIDSDVVEILFTAVDRLTGMVDQLKDSGSDNLEYQSITEQIQSVLDSAGVTRQLLTESQMQDAIQNNSEVAEAMSTEVPANTVAQMECGNGAGESVKSVAAPVADDPFAELVDETEIPPKYRAIFIDETVESLENLYELLLGESTTIQVDPVLVRCHQIKGSAASIGLNRPAKLAHLMEDVLQEIRDTSGVISQPTCDALMYAVDALRVYVGVLSAEISEPDNFSEAYRILMNAHCDSSTSETGMASTSVELAARGVSSTERPAMEMPNVSPQPRDGQRLTELEKKTILSAAPHDVQGLLGVMSLEENIALPAVKALLAFNRLESIGNLFFKAPEEEQIESTRGCVRLLFGLVTDLPPAEVEARINLEGVESISIEPLNAASSSQPASNPAIIPIPNVAAEKPSSATPANRVSDDTRLGGDAPNRKGVPQSEVHSASTHPTPPKRQEQSDVEPTKSKPAETLRVDIERLDQLMNLAGQLVINKARFGQVRDKLKRLAGNKQPLQRLSHMSDRLKRTLEDAEDSCKSGSGKSDVFQGVQSNIEEVMRDLDMVRTELAQLGQARTLVNDLSDAVHQLERVADGIQKSVMDTRMVPVGPLFTRFKRVIRDITRVNGKDIQLVIRGEKTELDKRMIDELADPLIHMVRNSADHGIESPESREASGKPRQGTVTLDAFHRGNRVLIRVQDDGKGLDPEKLREKAVSKGIISVQDAERLTQQESFQLIWEPGFSTAEKITEISGRGMGMDIVRSKIENLNGTIDLDSILGEGTTITIKLPLTMAILPSLLIVIDGDVYAIPVESVVEIVKVQKKDMPSVHGKLTARVRDRVVSVVELHGLFRKVKKPAEPRAAASDRTLVIIGSDGSEMGLVVDHLIGEDDIVVKSLAENYRNVYGLAGASILGDGRVSLILDVTALTEMAKRKQNAA